MPRAPLAEHFAAHLHSTRLLLAGERVLVAFSGGLDSACLLHLLRFAVPEFRLSLHAAHFDHGLRPTSAGEAAWSAGVCRAWSVPLAAGRAASPPRGEAAARVLRYEFLHVAARAHGADVIVTGHHADDQLETILFRLARGTGSRGLSGIPARRGSVIRPLLQYRRAELLAYARAVRLRWREDESNAWLGFTRNRIRHVVLPALEAAWPAAADRLLSLARCAAELEALWEAVLPQLLDEVVRSDSAGRYELARGVLQAYHPQSRARVMRALAHRLDAPLDRVATRAAVAFAAHGESGTTIALGSRLQLEREFDRLILRFTGWSPPASDRPAVVASAGEGTSSALIGGVAYQVRWGPLRPAGQAAEMSASFDPSTLRFPLELRGWRPGDRIRLGYGTKKLKKLFGERHVARSHRAAVPVLAEQAGEGGVLWIAGMIRADVAGSGEESWHITVSNGESVPD